MAAESTLSYNERLFSGNWRTYIHTRRFRWLVEQITELNLHRARIVELGCYDAKTLQFLEHAGIVPHEYLGLDANLDGGLDLGLVQYRDRVDVKLQFCERPDDIPTPEQPWNIGICMETLDCVSPDLVEAYLHRLGQVADGYIFITVPIQLGVVFFLRRMAKVLLRAETSSYSAREYVYALMGRLDKVERAGRKGFDYRCLIKQVGRYFDIVSISGICPGLPLLSLNFQCGIVAKTKG
jgi:hypothetical protein